MYASTNRELRIHKAKTDRTKVSTEKSTIILNDLKTTLTITNTTSRSIINKDIRDMRNVIKQLHLMIFMEHSTHKLQNMHSFRLYLAYR